MSAPAEAPRTGTAGTWPARLGLALFAALLGLASWPGTQVGSFSAFPQGERSAHTYSVFGPAGLLLHHSPSSESLSSPAGSTPAPGAKDRVSESDAIVRAADRSVRSATLRIARSAGSTLVALRRSALLFPFHFFW